MNAAQEFLEKNGFEQVNATIMKGDKCSVGLYEKHYTVYFEGGQMYSPDLKIYWLIGVLTYYELIDKNYKQ